MPTSGGAAHFSPALVWLLPALLAAMLLLYAAAPATRRRLKAALVLALASAGGFLLASAMRHLGLNTQSGIYRLAHGLSCFVLIVAAIKALAAAVFDIPQATLHLALPALVQDLLMALAYVASALAVISHEGANLTGLLATSAIVTAVVAFSLQDTLGNVIGGMVLQLEQSFAPGDWIRSGSDEGMVREIRWRQTTLENCAGDTIVIPNSALMKSAVTVFGRAGRASARLMKIAFNASYEHAPNDVIGAVENALREDPPAGVAVQPPPWCVLVGFTDNNAAYIARYWLEDPARQEYADSDARIRIFYALSRAGVSLCVPARSLIVTQKDSDLRERDRSQELERHVAALRRLDIFQPLSAEEIQTLAERLKPAPFARGETITRQGSLADWLYLVYSGEAEVSLHAGRSFQSVAKLTAGDFLGEMSLMTGEPRSATIVALTDVVCYRLDRADIKDVLARRPEIAQSISLILARRQTALQTARDTLQEEAGPEPQERSPGHFLDRIRSIFSLG